MTDPFALLPCPVCTGQSDCPRCQGTRLSPVMWLIGSDTQAKKIIAAFDEGNTPQTDRPMMQVSSLVADGNMVIIPIPINLTELLWQSKQSPFQVKPSKGAPLYY